MHEIERTLGRWASTPHIMYDKGKVESHMLEVRRILDTLNAPNSPPHENITRKERAPNLVTVDPYDVGVSSEAEKGMFFIFAFTAIVRVLIIRHPIMSIAKLQHADA